MLKRNIIIAICLLLCAFNGVSQKRFDPERFKAKLHKYIIEQTELSNQEQIAFFPIYDQMLDKQRGIFLQLRALRHVKLTSDQQAKALIAKADKLEIELKMIEQKYHKQLLRVISARKLCYILKAERHFHRAMLRKFAEKHQ